MGHATQQTYTYGNGQTALSSTSDWAPGTGPLQGTGGRAATPTVLGSAASPTTPAPVLASSKPKANPGVAAPDPSRSSSTWLTNPQLTLGANNNKKLLGE